MTRYKHLKYLKIAILDVYVVIQHFHGGGGYIINNPNKLVIIPNKFLNTNDDFSGMCLDYKIIDI